MHLNWFYATSFTRALNNLLTYKTTEVMDFYKGVSKDFETLRKAMQGPLSHATEQQETWQESRESQT